MGINHEAVPRRKQCNNITSPPLPEEEEEEEGEAERNPDRARNGSALDFRSCEHRDRFVANSNLSCVKNPRRRKASPRALPSKKVHSPDFRFDIGGACSRASDKKRQYRQLAATLRAGDCAHTAHLRACNAAIHGEKRESEAYTSRFRTFCPATSAWPCPRGKFSSENHASELEPRVLADASFLFSRHRVAFICLVWLPDCRNAFPRSSRISSSVSSGSE